MPLITNAISNTGELYDWNEFDVLLKHERPRNRILFFSVFTGEMHSVFHNPVKDLEDKDLLTSTIHQRGPRQDEHLTENKNPMGICIRKD